MKIAISAASVVSALCAVLIVLSFSACPKQSEQDAAIATETPGNVMEPDLSITLTKAQVDRYIKTLPAFAKIAKDAGEMYETVSDVLLAKPEVDKLLKDDGWKDPREFVNVHGKIWGVSGWIGAYDSMRGQPEATREAYTKTQYQPEFNRSNVSDEERQLLWNSQPQLLKAVEKAGE